MVRNSFGNFCPVCKTTQIAWRLFFCDPCLVKMKGEKSRIAALLSKPSKTPLKTIDLHSGSRSFSKVADDFGFDTFCVDWTDYDNTDLVIDIEFLTVDDLPYIPDILWSSPDCRTYSIAAVSHHRNFDDRSGKTDYAQKCDRVNLNVLKLIADCLLINPNMKYYIENPRGILRKMDFMADIPIRHTIWYCQYGDTRAKPTDIWTNDSNWTPRPMCHNKRRDSSGAVIEHCHHESAPRGSPTGTQGRSSSFTRSQIPHELFGEIFTQLERIS